MVDNCLVMMGGANRAMMNAVDSGDGGLYSAETLVKSVISGPMGGAM